MAQPPILTHRIATKDELPLLIRFREECGYGLPGLMKGINDPDRIYCVFMMDIDGEKRDVGMACWYLHQPDNLDLACRDTGIVLIGKLSLVLAVDRNPTNLIMWILLTYYPDPMKH